MITTLEHPRALATLSASVTVACTTGKPWPENAQLRDVAVHDVRRAYGHQKTRTRGTSPD
jgi:hypothetical protein